MVFRFARGGLLVHQRGDAVGGEHDRLALGHLVELLDEDRAARLQVGHHVLVVHDLLAHVDRGAVEVQRLLDGDHGAVDAGAVAAGRGQAHGALGLVGREDARRTQVSHGPNRRCRALRVRAMPLETSPEHPAPVRQITQAIGQWVERLGRRLGRGPGHPDQPARRDEHRLPHAARQARRHLGPGHLQPRGDRLAAHAAGRGRPDRLPRQAVVLRQPRHALARRPRDPAGRRGRAARPARATAPAAGRRGPVRRGAQAPAAVPARATSGWSPPRTPPPSATCSTTAGAAGRACTSR